jgi:hypothetical protein
MRRRKARAAIQAKHHAFQQLLRTGQVIVNPYEPLLASTDRRLSMRRDNLKFLRLILTITFLFQEQRPVHPDPELGDYICSTLDDIAIASALCRALLSQDNDELPGPCRDLLERTLTYARAKAEKAGIEIEQVSFYRRELREALGWSETQLRTYLRLLVRLEYLVPISGHRQGQTFSYRLVSAEAPRGGTRQLPWFKDMETMRREASAQGLPAQALRPETLQLCEQLRGKLENFAEASREPAREVNHDANGSVQASCVEETATSRNSRGKYYTLNIAEPYPITTQAAAS